MAPYSLVFWQAYNRDFIDFLKKKLNTLKCSGVYSVR